MVNKSWNLFSTFVVLVHDHSLRKAASISLLVYYLFGTLWLPDGNFSILPDLPEMYKHCRATEDKNLTVFEFVTDHLLDVDDIWEARDEANEKPHVPIPSHHQQVLNAFFIEVKSVCTEDVPLPACKPSSYHKELFASDHISKIFHPPLFVA